MNQSVTIDPVADNQTRVTAATVESVVRLIHLAKHQFLIPYVADKRVLDTGCGAGYGLKLLSEHYKSAVGIDGNRQAIQHAKSSQIRAAEFKQLNLDEFSLDTNDFEVAIAVDVIQQLKNPRLYLKSVKRHLADSGLFIVITPNLNLLHNANPCHYREYTARSLRSELEPYFKIKKLYGLHKLDQSARLQKLWQLDKYKLRERTPAWLNKLTRHLFGIPQYEELGLQHYPINTQLKNAYSLIAVCEPQSVAGVAS